MTTTIPEPTPAPFNPAAPLPPLRSHGADPKHSWEPAARRYRDLEPEEREQ